MFPCTFPQLNTWISPSLLREKTPILHILKSEHDIVGFYNIHILYIFSTV